MKRLLQDPLFHFLLLGAAIFIGYSVLTPPGSGGPGTVVVTAGQIEHLVAGFARTWQRPPSDAELKGLIDDWVREEVATREALALGLDQGDTVIRRRLRQKLEFVSDDITARAEPTDADLSAFLRAHPESFGVEPRFTFSQVYLDPSKRGTRLARDVEQLLVRLNREGITAGSSSPGDSVLLERTFQSVTAREVAKQFGDQFAAALAALSPGQWQGPVASGLGVHLVLVSEREEGRLPDLADVRDAVRREWANARRLEGTAQFYEALLQRYTVIVEDFDPGKGQKAPAESQ